MINEDLNQIFEKAKKHTSFTNRGMKPMHASVPSLKHCTSTFLSGVGGTGKSFLIEAISKLEPFGKNTLHDGLTSGSAWLHPQVWLLSMLMV